MYTFLLTVHVANCVLMILVVMLQAGRGAGLNVFGGGGGDAMFNSPSGSNFMKQLTAGLAVTFGVTSLLLTLISGRSGMSSVTSKFQMPAAPQQQGAPQQPPAQQQAPATSGGAQKGSAPVKK